MTDTTLISAFVRWTWLRAVLHNGWWLVTSLYLVVDAGLSAAQLVFVGAGQAVMALLCEVPAGVLADTVSRKWSLVVSHGLMGTAILLTGLVTAFPALVATQMLWGLSWTFASGSDVAWITDELRRPRRIPSVLTRAARAQLTGAATGLVGFGLLSLATTHAAAMVTAGIAMLVLGLGVAATFPEQHFVPTRTRPWSSSRVIFSNGLSLVRWNRTILVIFAATFLVNGASDAWGRLYPRQLLLHGFPTAPDPIVWFTALGIVGLLLATVVLRLAQKRLEAVAARRDYALAAMVGVVGLLVMARPAGAALGSAATLLVAGVTVPLARTIATIWVNAETTSDVRATVHSFLAQSEYLGELVCGVLLALLARAAGIGAAIAGCAVLFAMTAGLMLAPGPSSSAERSTPTGG